MSLPPFERGAERQWWIGRDCALWDMAVYDFWVQVGVAALCTLADKDNDVWAWTSNCSDWGSD